MCTNVWAWKDHIDTVHLRGYNLCVELYNTCLIRVCVCVCVHVHVRAGNHHFNIALIKLPIYRCESTQEPFLGRLPPAAGRCQALWNPISSLLSDHYPLLSLSSPLSSSIGRERGRKRPMVGHPSTQPAGVGSTPTKSSRHLLGSLQGAAHCKK